MKLFRTFWLFFIVLALILPSCDDDDDEDLLGNWEKLGAFDGYSRSDAVVFVIGDYAYLGTGYNFEDDLEFRDFYRYDSNADSWLEVASMPSEAPTRHGAVAFSIGGKGYVGTGLNDKSEDKLKDFWEFDPSVGDSGQWKQIADFPGSARYSAVAFSVDGKGYVGTGYDGRRRKDFYRYNPSTGEWETITPVGGSLRRDAVAFVLDNKGYIFMGTDNDVNVTDAFVYDPEVEKWTELREITSDTNDDESYDDDYNIAGYNAVAFTMNGYGYVTTGGPGYATSKTWEYDPATDFWVEKTEFEGSSRVNAVGFTINNRGYVAVGSSAVDSGNDYGDVWTFYPNDEQDDNDN